MLAINTANMRVLLRTCLLLHAVGPLVSISAASVVRSRTLLVARLRSYLYNQNPTRICHPVFNRLPTHAIRIHRQRFPATPAITIEKRERLANCLTSSTSSSFANGIGKPFLYRGSMH